jgi:hypothetical protein
VASIANGGSPIKVGDTTYTLTTFTMNDWDYMDRWLQERYKDPTYFALPNLPAVLSSAGGMIQMVYRSLHRNHPELTADDVGELPAEVFGALIPALLGLLGADIPKAVESKKKTRAVKPTTKR